MKVPLVDLKAEYSSIREEIDSAIKEVLEAQTFILGPKVEELEEKIAKYCNVKHAIGVASGTDALLLSLMAVGIGQGDEVITTPFTFFATAGSIYRLKAKPVFVDIDLRTYNIDPSLIEEKITKKTKAIIPVHLYGQCADMDSILEIAKKHNLYVIEDSAQAIGAKYKGRNAGSMGDLGCLSFFPTKNLGGYGDGGMVLTNDDDLARKVKMLRVHGSEVKYYHSTVGINSRLDAIQAAVLLVKLKYLDEWNESRRQNAKFYNLAFDGSNVITPYEESHNYHIYHQYVIRIKERDIVRKRLQEMGIGTEVYYPLPLHLQSCFSELGYKEGDLPNSELSAKEVLALPIYPKLTREQQQYVANSIRELVQVSCF